MPNVLKFASALFALHQVNLLKDPSCKDPVKLFIRQATEQKHWHTTSHYRSKEASKFLGSQTIRSKAEYQRLCVGNLRHEHVVPNEVIYQIILSESEITKEFLANVLRKYGIRATITREEDRLLLTDRMPPEFYQIESDMYLNPFARYMVSGIHDSLERLTDPAWY